MGEKAEIYVLKCPKTDEVRYVGKANDSQARLKSHLRDACRRQTPVYCWIKSLRVDGLIPTIEVLCKTDNWVADEQRIIAEYMANGTRLLNIAAGGDEPFCSREQRQINGRNTLQKLRADPKRKQIMDIKRRIGQYLRMFKKWGDAERHNRYVDKLRGIAERLPNQCGEWSRLEYI